MKFQIFLWCLKAKFEIPLSAEGCLWLTPQPLVINWKICGIWLKFHRFWVVISGGEWCYDLNSRLLEYLVPLVLIFIVKSWSSLCRSWVSFLLIVLLILLLIENLILILILVLVLVELLFQILVLTIISNLILIPEPPILVTISHYCQVSSTFPPLWQAKPISPGKRLEQLKLNKAEQIWVDRKVWGKSKMSEFSGVVLSLLA